MASVPLQLVLEHRRARATQDDIEAIGEAVDRDRGVQVEWGDEALPGCGIGDGAEDGVHRDERIALEVHLSDKPLRKARTEYREMDMCGTPGIDVVAERIRARLYRTEGIVAIVIGHHPAAAAKIGIDRRQVGVV